MVESRPASDADATEPGLSDEEAAQRLRRDGPNRLVQRSGRGWATIVAGIATQPMFLLLLATALVYAGVGSPGDAVALLLSVIAVVTITFVQEYRTERLLASLKELSSPRARVVRSGKVRRIASQDLVVGDRLLVAEGDRLACDAVLVETHGLMLDESMLTGESAPVLKSPRSPAVEAAGHTLYAGTLVVQGDGAAVVSATGARTALGAIGGTLATIEPRPSRAHRELQRTVARMALFAVATSLLAAVLYAARRGDWSEGLIAGLTLAMAIVPEEFAVVWTVMLALGAWRLAQQQVLTRQAQAIEALGTTSVLAVDKTGTLTHNRMELLALATPDAAATLTSGSTADARFEPLLEAAALASVDDGIEPMDLAVLRLQAHSYEHVDLPRRLLRRTGVAPEQPWFSQLWRLGEDDAGVWAIKGAPEAVLAMCRMDPDLAARVRGEAEVLARQGLRVLGVARADWRGAVPSQPQTLPLAWVGLLGFMDPVREEVPAAIAQCRRAGMRVVMITGDAPQTAAAIARSAGLVEPGADKVVTGAQLSAMPDAELDALAPTTSIYARVSPAQKLRIVRALQRRGDVVAMTGDGVNDASALRAADIGVAMGQRGSDVAREAAALVLLEDSFTALVDGVRIGRRIFGNLRHAVGYLIAVHVPIVSVSLLPVLTGGPALLLPLHVVLLELIIDPACSLVFEAEPEPDNAMTRPPRPAHVGLLSSASVLRALGIGALAMLGVVVIVLAGTRAGVEAPWIRLFALAALIAGNLLMLVWFLRGADISRMRGRNPALQWLLIGVAAAAGAVLLAAPGLPQLGLPASGDLRIVGALLAALAVAAAVALRRHRTFITPGHTGMGQRAQAPFAPHQDRRGADCHDHARRRP